MDKPQNTEPKALPNTNLYSLLPNSKIARGQNTFLQKAAFKLADVKSPIYPAFFVLFAAHVFVIGYLFSDDFLSSVDMKSEDVADTLKSLVYYTKSTKEKFTEIKSKFSALMPGGTDTSS